MAHSTFVRVCNEARHASPASAAGYLLGAMHDGTSSSRHRTTRFCQSDRRWLEALRLLLSRLEHRSWIYKEGKERRVWVLETCWRPPRLSSLHHEARAAYARAYFDTEGGIPRDPAARFYIQFAQKNHGDLQHVHDVLTDLGIESGKLHNPSHRVDPSYWRFFIRARSHRAFATAVSSWHPSKRALLEARFFHSS